MRIIGYDSETCYGKPFSLQFFGETETETCIKWVDEKTALKEFFSYVSALRSDTYVMYALNLNFDLISAFYSKKDLLLKEEFEFDYYSYNIKGVYAASMVYVQIQHKTKHKTILIVDIGRFFTGSLKNLANLFCPGTPKLPQPQSLGKAIYTKEDKSFCRYAMRDAEICYLIGNRLQILHEKFDVQQSVSVAQFAARVFRRQHLQYAIPLPSRSIVFSALHAYHGGKNLYPHNKIKLWKDIYIADITSAYPHAMYGFPSFSNIDSYFYFSSNNCPGDKVEHVPELGVYKISGLVSPCIYPVIFNNAFKAVRGQIENVWVTGYEINEALRSQELILYTIYGYGYDADKDDCPSPFKSYVNYFFHQKDKADDKILKIFNKTLLNALYGKFIQTIKKDISIPMLDLDTSIIRQGKILKAGGLFNPFIAALITGHTRAHIHQLEHKYKSIHTATDSVVTQSRPEIIPGLGGIKIEFEGDILIFRNKLYICYNNDKSGLPSRIFPGKYIQKYGLHGYRGTVYDLERMYSTGVYSYTYNKVNKLKESHKQGLQVNLFEEKTATLKIKGV